MIVGQNQEQVIKNWGKFLNGNKEAFAEIYNLFVDDLYRYGTKLCVDEELVKDAIQEVFMDLYLNHRNKEVFTVGLKFYLMLAIKRNLIRKIQKSRKNDNRRIVEADLFETQYSFEEQLISEESNTEINEKLKLAMDQLPSKQKEAIYLRYNQSLQYEQISEMMGISVESVRKQVYRAIKTIRDRFDESGLILFSILKSRWVFAPGTFVISW